MTALCAIAVSCGASSTPAQSQTSAPSSLRTVAFNARIPAGWSDITSSRAAAGLVHLAGTLLLLLEAAPAPPVYAGVNDVEANIAVVRLDQAMQPAQLPSYLSSVTAYGAVQVSSPLPITVDGAAGTFVTYQSSAGGTPVESEDIAVNQAGATYEVELTTSRYAFTSHVGALLSLLASWEWMTQD